MPRLTLSKRRKLKKITSDIEIDDTYGKSMKAVDVFGAIIGNLKSQLCEELFHKSTGLIEGDIFWIIAVPDSWPLDAHLLIQEAAYKAGIKKDSLSMTTQSVAALTFCQRMHKTEMGEACGTESTVGNQKDNIVVINAGHDDTHISVYKRNTETEQLELHKAYEGPWGGTCVDDQLYSTLSVVIGRSVHQMLRDFNEIDILDFQRTLKSKWMRTQKSQINVRITLYRCKFALCIMQGILQTTKPDEGIVWAVGKIGIKTETYETFFKPCIDKIVHHVQEILLKPNSVEATTYILVGELSESPIFQDAIRKALPNGK